MKKVLVLGVAITCSACSAEDRQADQPGAEARSGAARQAIVNGTKDEPPAKYPMVGQLEVEYSYQSISDCTATLLSCGAALTAAHCVWKGGYAKWQTARISTDWKSGAPECRSGDGMTWSLHKTVISRPGAPDPAEEGVSPTDEQDANDVAILKIAPQTPRLDWVKKVNRLPYPKLGSPGSVSAGMQLTVVGCDGEFMCAGGPSGSVFFQRRYGESSVQAVASPLGRLVLGGINGVSTEQGDSGGALFLSNGDVVPTIVGVDASKVYWFYAANLTNPTIHKWVVDSLDSLDSDHDGVPDACDLCPGADIKDSSDLGVHCQGCPDGVVDEDGDLVCDNVDNCVGAASSGQSNLNVDYEKAYSTKSFGDACDITPVAKPVALGTTMAWGPQAALCGPDSPDPNPDLSWCAARINTYNMRLRTAKHDPGPGFDNTVTASTDFRYCVCRNDDGTPISNKKTCFTDKHCAIANTEYQKMALPDSYWWLMRVHPGPAAIDENGVSFSPVLWSWNGLSVKYVPGSAFAPHDPYHAGTYGTASWDWMSDATAWANSGWIESVSAPPGFPPGADMPGVLWTHNDSLAGMSEQYGKMCTEVSDECGFGNNYILWNPSRRTYACPLFSPWKKPEIGEPALMQADSSQFAEQRWFPEPAYTLSIPLVSEPSVGASMPFDTLVVGNDAIDPGIAVPCGSDGDQIAQLSAGSLVATQISEFFSAESRQLLRQRPDLTWLEPSEPFNLVGAGLQPLAVSVGRATGQVATSIIVSPDGTFTLSPTHRTGPVGLMASILGSPAAVGPSAYSRLAGLIVQLTGSTAGAALDTLRVTPVDGEASEVALLPIEHRPMNARAATYSYWDRKMWIVGAAPGPASHQSLYSIQTDTGKIEGRRRILPALSKFWLTTTSKREVVLVAAHKNAPWYTVAVIAGPSNDANDTLVLAGVNMKPGVVIGAPHVSSDTLLVPTADATPHPHDRLNPAGIHVDALTLSSLRNGVHGQCFQPD